MYKMWGTPSRIYDENITKWITKLTLSIKSIVLIDHIVVKYYRTLSKLLFQKRTM